MRLGNCRWLIKRPLKGTWYRAIQPQFWPTLLATSHTATIPGRFNAGNSTRPGFEVFYLAEDQLVALFEVRASLGCPLPGGAYIPNPKGAWTVVNVDIQLNRVAHLTRASQRKLIETTVEELTGDWRGYAFRDPNFAVRPPNRITAPTQLLGAAMFAAKNLEGFTTYSATWPTRRNRIVFPEKLQTGSYIRFHDPATLQTHTISAGP